MTEEQTYTFATWNVAGITSETNLHIIKDTITQYNIDIICLQECRFSHFNLYNYTFLINHNSLTQNHVAMIIRNDLTITDVFHHPQGKILSVCFNAFVVVNIHAPSGANYLHEREAFFLHEVSCAMYGFRLPVLLLGDMNCVLAHQDCTSPATLSCALQDIIITFSLTDVWRHQHTHMRQYTYFYSQGASRLDKIYIPTTLIPSVSHSSIHKLAVSDHSMVLVKSKFPATKHFRQSFNWHFNNSLLHNEYYKFLICQELAAIQEKQRYALQTPIQRWLSIKNKLIHLSKQYSRELAQLKRTQFDYYHTLLNQLAARYPDDPTLLPEIKQTQAHLKRLYANKLQGLIIRSKLHPSPGIAASLLHIKAEKKRQHTFINN
jgi:exonuclease III